MVYFPSLGDRCSVITGFWGRSQKCGKTPKHKVSGRSSSHPLLFQPALSSLRFLSWVLPQALAGHPWPLLSWKKTTTQCPGLSPQRSVGQTISSARQPSLVGLPKKLPSLQPFCYHPCASQTHNSSSTLLTLFSVLVFWPASKHLHISFVHPKSKTTCASTSYNRISFQKPFTWLIVPCDSRSLGIDLDSSCPSLIPHVWLLINCNHIFLWNLSCLFCCSCCSTPVENSVILHLN